MALTREKLISLISSGSLSLAYRAPSPTAGHVATLDADGDPTDSGKAVADFATSTQGTKADDAVRYTTETGRTDAQKAAARGNILTNLQTYTDASQIGITISDTTTLEQLATAMPNGSELIIVPPTTATSNISPAAERYVILHIIRRWAYAVTVFAYTRNSSSMYHTRLYSSDSGVTWTVDDWSGDMMSTAGVVCQSGTVSVFAASGETGSQAVTFPTAFASVPQVLPTLNTGYPGAGRVASVSNITTTGFTAYLYNPAANVTLSVAWLAVKA